MLFHGRQASKKSRESAQILGRAPENIPFMSRMLAEHQETIQSGPEVMGVRVIISGKKSVNTLCYI